MRQVNCLNLRRLPCAFVTGYCIRRTIDITLVFWRCIPIRGARADGGYIFDLVLYAIPFFLFLLLLLEAFLILALLSLLPLMMLLVDLYYYCQPLKLVACCHCYLIVVLLLLLIKHVICLPS